MGVRIEVMSSDDDRFVVPLYSSAEAARHLDVPTSTFRSWAHGYRKQPKDRPAVVGEPIVTTLPPAVRTLRLRRRTLPSKDPHDPHDPHYRRLRYVRYADDGAPRTLKEGSV